MQALKLALGDDVDHARDRVGAVGRRSAVEQGVDASNGPCRDGVDVGDVTLRIVGQRVYGRTLAVEQHQRVGVVETAQRRRAGAGRETARNQLGGTVPALFDGIV